MKLPRSLAQAVMEADEKLRQFRRWIAVMISPRAPIEDTAWMDSAAGFATWLTKADQVLSRLQKDLRRTAGAASQRKLSRKK